MHSSGVEIVSMKKDQRIEVVVATSNRSFKLHGPFESRSFNTQRVKFVGVPAAWNLAINRKLSFSVCIHFEDPPNSKTLRDDAIFEVEIWKQEDLIATKTANHNFLRFTVLEKFIGESTVDFEVVVRMKCFVESDVFNSVSSSHAVATKTLSSVCGMFEDPTYADFRFKVGGREFKVHKNILASMCPVMDEMFSSTYRGINNVCEVTAITPEVFEMLLKFVYGLPLSIESLEMAKSLFEAAHFYQIKELKNFTAQHIQSKLTIDNCREVYDWIFAYDVECLKLAAWNLLKTAVLKIFYELEDEPWSPEKIIDWQSGAP